MNQTLTSESTISDIEQTVQSGLEALRNAPLSEQITAALKFLTPPGYRPIAQLEEDGRKKRSTASASNWSPATGEIVIYFERLTSESSPSVIRSSPSASTKAVVEPTPSWRRELPLTSTVGGPLAAIAQDQAANAKHAFNASSAGLQQTVPSYGKSSVEAHEVTRLQIQQCCEALAEAEKAGKSFIALKWFRDNDMMSHGYKWADSLAVRQAVLTKAIEVGAVLTSSIPNPKAPQHATTTIKLNRESEYAQAVTPRFRPIRARGGASASEIVIRDRGRF